MQDKNKSDQFEPYQMLGTKNNKHQINCYQNVENKFMMTQNGTFLNIKLFSFQRSVLKEDYSRIFATIYNTVIFYPNS